MESKMQARLQRIIEKILKGRSNSCVLKLISGNNYFKKAHSVENWIQVEFYKRLCKEFESCIVSIEDTKKNHDIVISSSQGQEQIDIELKDGKCGKALIKDVKKLANSSKGFLVIWLAFKSKNEQYEDLVEEFKNRAAIVALRKEPSVKCYEDPLVIIDNNAYVGVWCVSVKHKN